ncbi:MAG: phoR 3 [Firmicutes bacterium]|nr:phoR 3 [Bacillota bacterium]
MRTSLQNRLLYSYIILMVVVLVGVSLAISLLLREYFIASKSKELVNKGYEIGRIVDSYNDGRIDQNQFENFINSVDSILDARVWVVDNSRNILVISTPKLSRMGEVYGPANGQVRLGKGALGRAMRDLEQVFAGQVLVRHYYSPVYEENMLTVAVPLANDDGSVEAAVILNSPVRGIDEFLRQLYYSISGIGLLALGLTILVVRWLAGSIARPLKMMQKSAADMACGNYNTRINIASDDELGALGKSLNVLACELEKFVSNTTKMEKMRRDFVANVSHELRTPVTVIRGYTEALLDGTIGDAELAEKYQRVMRDETIRLERLINELLDLSRLEAENTSMAVENLPLAAIADGAVIMMTKRAEQKRVFLDLAVTTDESDIRGNGDRLTQLMLILLDNALKFTPAGGRITVGVERTAEKVVLTVADSGAGIPEADLPFIWERFYKVDKSHSRSETGTGLGLSIAREIIDRHGATVEVKSMSGQGTIFRILFPGV